MCEWLSFGEWTDVQLLCGGRSFGAHRAVLASVSTFLRSILLTSTDEAITLIVLPDFDLDAMSSVLYYIYNGEVVIQKTKLRMFLEIVHAMQIYVDSQYLSKIHEGIEEKYFQLVKYCQCISLPSEIFTLGLRDDNEQMFNIKKCKETQRSLVQYSPSDKDCLDNSVRCLNESELNETRLGNLKSPYEDRQRNTLLRDLFIETYPRNGNVNGLTGSVLAISNEYYHSPASQFLANSNSRHLSVEGPRPAPPNAASCHSLHSSAASATFNDGILSNTRRTKFNHPTLDTVNFINHCPINTQSTMKFYNDIKSYLDVEGNILTNGIQPSTSFFEGINIASLRRKSLEEKLKPTPARVIFNHVLESPWNARKPNNYRPFRRKEKLDFFNSTNNEEIKETHNDTNNNVPKSLSDSEGEPLQLERGSPLENRECYKCIHCDQVFTNAESLAVHMRRHSTNARYACGDCGKTFSQLRNFKYHMSIHRGTREFAATCSVCGKYFNDRGYLSSHMKIHRNRKEYKCTLCPKSFNQRVAYNMHVRIHTGVKPHVCDECGKAFSRKMLLKQHQRTHSGERPYACPHCDKCFADRSNMTLHVRLHTGVKPFSCPMCPKSFTKKHHLKSHLNFHTGSKPYSCPRCRLAFTQSSNMRTHYKKCTAEPLTETTPSTS